MKKPELLAPAGDFEKLKFAYAYGADAVYAGGASFGLRAYAGNLNDDELKLGAEYAHRLGRKIYIAVNIFAHEQDFAGLKDYLIRLTEFEIDGIIVSDPGILSLARRETPDLSVHLSTQANCTNAAGANFWFSQGVRRAVLARELTLEELKTLCPQAQGELEIFVHGAMCMSYSGRCLLSNYLTGRDANHGECTHPCRWGYALVEEKRPGQYFPLEEDVRGSYIFNSHDLCLLPNLPLLKDLNLASYKIEGRMKSAYYVASTVKVYREALDVLWEQGETKFREKIPSWLAEMDKVSHRDYSTGFLFGKPGAEAHNIETSNYIREYSFVGRVLEQEECAAIGKGNECGCWIEQRNHFRLGDELEVLAPEGEPWTFKVNGLWSLDGEKTDVARHPQQKLKIAAPAPLKPFSILRKVVPAR
ncbi:MULTISPECIES: U32 family peptidase [unclassified Dehalobacter]|uniref:peptidase U32 family protein n=1 Tax=unclassified Dehalobacter TaxID=2635733 RepID=UPI000E6D0052|nr:MULTISPECIES: U32 family peptidase [unclassified Dehalobacter]RJE48354.1 peptidase U32 [Dehalobacter sp. MCB1]TCX50423.1 peptidase U32 [Dehalobacter sp. 14DCB1]TCX52337.1 peptidase U32 [Dehalobacter sp. 12DCB1]